MKNEEEFDRFVKVSVSQKPVTQEFILRIPSGEEFSVNDIDDHEFVEDWWTGDRSHEDGFVHRIQTLSGNDRELSLDWDDFLEDELEIRFLGLS